MKRVKRMQNGYLIKADWVEAGHCWDLTASTGCNEFYLGSVFGFKNDSMDDIMHSIRLSNLYGDNNDKR